MTSLKIRLHADLLAQQIAGLNQYIAGLEFALRNREAKIEKARASDLPCQVGGRPARMSLAEKHQRREAADVRRRIAIAQAERDELARQLDRLGWTVAA